MLTIDLHNKRLEEAKEILLDFIDEAVDKKEVTIEVIHGFNKGQALKEMVNSLTSNDHPYILRVRQKIGNSGSSYIDLYMDVY